MQRSCQSLECHNFEPMLQSLESWSIQMVDFLVPFHIRCILVPIYHLQKNTLHVLQTIQEPCSKVFLSFFIVDIVQYLQVFVLLQNRQSSHDHTNWSKLRLALYHALQHLLNVHIVSHAWSPRRSLWLCFQGAFCPVQWVSWGHLLDNIRLLPMCDSLFTCTNERGSRWYVLVRKVCEIHWWLFAV